MLKLGTAYPILKLGTFIVFVSDILYKNITKIFIVFNDVKELP